MNGWPDAYTYPHATPNRSARTFVHRFQMVDLQGRAERPGQPRRVVRPVQQVEVAGARAVALEPGP